MSVRRLRVALFLVLMTFGAMFLASACGGGDDDGGTAAATSPAATATPGTGPGTITITSSSIAGQSGKILLVYVTSNGGGQLARACVSITSNDFTVPATVMTDVPSGNDPCGGNTSETTFNEGTYSITAGVYVGGQQTAEAVATVKVDVAGDVTAELDGAALSN